MAKKFATRGGQYPITSEFVIDVATDTMVNSAGAEVDFKTVGPNAFDAILLPAGAVITGGEVVTEVAVSGSTAYNVSVGDAASATRYLAATDHVTAKRTPLVPTGLVSDGSNVRITVAPTVAAATAGKVAVRITYVIRNRMNEVQTH